MNSLEDLNNYGKGLIQYPDDREYSIEYTLLPTPTFTPYQSTSFTPNVANAVAFGNLVAVDTIDYEMDFSAIQSSANIAVTFSNVGSGTITSNVETGIFTVTGIDRPLTLYSVGTPLVSLGNVYYADNFQYNTAVTFTGAEGSDTISWLSNVDIIPVGYDVLGDQSLTVVQELEFEYPRGVNAYVMLPYPYQSITYTIDLSAVQAAANISVTWPTVAGVTTTNVGGVYAAGNITSVADFETVTHPLVTINNPNYATPFTFTSNVSDNLGITHAWNTYINARDRYLPITFDPADDSVVSNFETYNFSITYPTAITAGTGNIYLHKTSDDSLVETINISNISILGSTASFITAPMEPLTGYYILLDQDIFIDSDNIGVKGITDKTTWNFTTRDSYSYTTLDPADNSILNEFYAYNFSITYSTDITSGAGNIYLHKTSDDSLVETINIASVSIVGNTASFTFENVNSLTGYYILLDEDIFVDPDNISVKGITDKTTWNFTTGVPYLPVQFTLDNPNAYGTSASDNFGYSVAVSGNYAIIGAYAEDDSLGTNSGKAYIFNVTTGALVHTLNNPNAYGTSAHDNFGIAVAISDNYAIVGAWTEDDTGGTSSGKAYIFNVTTGALIHTLNNPNAYGTSAADYFSRSVAIDGNYAIVGAPSEDDAGSPGSGIPGTGSGKAYIFNVTTGALLWTLNNPNAYGSSAGDGFGHSVAVSGNYAIVGAPYEDDSLGTYSGKAYIFNVTTGALVRTINNSQAIGNRFYDYFGYSVDISGNYAIIGAWNEDETNGTAYIVNVTTGAFVHKLNNPLPNLREFGRSVAIDGNYAIVGTPSVASGSYSATYIFNITTGALEYTLNNPNPYGTAIDDVFGFSVAISGADIIIGAPYEDYAGGYSSGKAYTYKLPT